VFRWLDRPASGACIAGLCNVFRDDLDVVHLAEATACEGEAKACNVQRVFVERGPLSETFELVTPRMEHVRVRCTRKEILIGDYACEVRERRPFQQAARVVQGRPMGHRERAAGHLSPSCCRRRGPSGPVEGHRVPCPKTPTPGIPTETRATRCDRDSRRRGWGLDAYAVTG